MQYTIPIGTLFTQVFGLAGPMIRRYKVTKDESKPYLGAYNIEVNKEEELEFIYNSLGTPVQFPMAFTGSTGYKYMDAGRVKRKFVSGSYLPFTSVASFTRAKRLTETPMSGDDDEIEMYGHEPWRISIKGFIIHGEKSLINKGEPTVGDQVQQLQEFESLADAIGVTGKIFEWLNIHRIAIKSIRYPDARDLDMSVIKPFEIEARSVKPSELESL